MWHVTISLLYRLYYISTCFLTYGSGKLSSHSTVQDGTSWSIPPVDCGINNLLFNGLNQLMTHHSIYMTACWYTLVHIPLYWLVIKEGLAYRYESTVSCNCSANLFPMHRLLSQLLLFSPRLCVDMYTSISTLRPFN